MDKILTRSEFLTEYSASFIFRGWLPAAGACKIYKRRAQATKFPLPNIDLTKPLLLVLNQQSLDNIDFLQALLYAITIQLKVRFLIYPGLLISFCG